MDEEDDGGDDGHAGAARQWLWPRDSRRRVHGGVRAWWGNAEESAVDLEGRGRGGVNICWGRGSDEAERGAVAALSTRRRQREGAAGMRPCSDPGRGNREGRRQGEAGRFGRMGQVGRPGWLRSQGQGLWRAGGLVASWASRPSGGVFLPFFVFICFLFISFYFILYIFCFTKYTSSI